MIIPLFILCLILPKIPAHINSTSFFIKDVQTKPDNILKIREGVNDHLYFKAVYRLFGFVQLIEIFGMLRPE